jgi:hypothetical protein
MSSSDIEIADSSQPESELSQQLVEVDVIVVAAYKPGPERLTHVANRPRFSCYSPLPTRAC